MWGFLFGAAGMFATMYSTQAILPQLGREFGDIRVHNAVAQIRSLLASQP